MKLERVYIKDKGEINITYNKKEDEARQLDLKQKDNNIVSKIHNYLLLNEEKIFFGGN